MIKFLSFLPIILRSVSRKRLLSIYLGSLFFNSFTNEFFIEFTGGDIISLIVKPNILGGPNRNSPNWTILDNWVLKNLILADEPFDNHLRNLVIS